MTEEEEEDEEEDDEEELWDAYESSTALVVKAGFCHLKRIFKSPVIGQRGLWAERIRE